MREFIGFLRFFYSLTGKSVFLLLLAMLGTGFFEVVGISMFFPILGGNSIDNPLSRLINGTFSLLNVECSIRNLLILMVVLFFIRTIFMIIQSRYVAKYTADLLVNLRVKTVRKLFESDYLLFLSKDSGFISNALMTEFNKVSSALKMFFQVIMGGFFHVFI